MITNVFVNNDNNVETYLLNIDIEKLKELQKRIDLSFGKGEILTYKGRYIKEQENKKIEIISKKQVNSRISCNDYFNYSTKRPIYLFRYRSYTPHQLSRICESFIEVNDKEFPLNYSFCLKKMLKFKPSTKKERKYYYEILSCFSFKKYDMEKLVESDIDLLDKKNILNKLKKILTKTKESKEKYFLPQSYIDIINEEIKMKEFISTQKRYKTVQYSDDYKNQIKKKRLFSLANKKELLKHNLI